MGVSRNSLQADLLGRLEAFAAARLTAGDAVYVGLSGGCDSVVLLHLLSRAGLAGRLAAIHVHHGLSPNADAWADFCSACCQSLGVPLIVRSVNVERNSGHGLEAAARQARYAAFSESLPAGACLLLAQHRGDQAETVLFNLLRGAGVAGAAAMRDERAQGALRLLRPLLDVSRGEIEAYARQYGLRWIDDESNADTRFTRNFLRHEALTAINQRFPNAEVALARAAANFAEASDLLDELAAEDWQRVVDGKTGTETARLVEMRSLSLARLKNLLRWRLRQLGWQVPVAARLDEFSRQLMTAAPDRHPELVLPAGTMRLARGRLHWSALE
ncbi:tRNA lysidine(34) synthetase TilS [Azonexus sp.]|uniref:tRNA lysidine(34) synthetase TilS n=1 Tax=Azonexus sp. TaxID=1872668 RepID=UPI0027B8D3DA|nr:tRNA lysidine(34) synthetase TilS [Azonexus sp.]